MMTWTQEEKIKDWKGRDVTIGCDADGDLGIIDADGYSIIIDRKETLYLAIVGDVVTEIHMG